MLAASHIKDLFYIPLFTLGAIIMRGAGCVVNDIYDRHLDAQVERTRSRPLASGEISVPQALLFLSCLLLLGLAVLLFLNRFTIWLGIASLALVFLYPLMKRVTWWPQLFLGFTFNWGALLGWSAVQATIGLPALLVYIAGIFWTLGYDTIYAYQDIRDDEHVGIKSTARLFGNTPLPWITLFYTVTTLFLMLAGLTANLGPIYYNGLIVAALYEAVQLVFWKKDNPEDCRQRFNSNRNFGLLVLLSIVLGKLL